MPSYNFTSGVRKALAVAREIAIEHGSEAVGVEHIVIALLEAGRDRDMKNFVKVAGLNTDRLRADLRSGLEVGENSIRMGELPYEEEARNVLEAALATSERHAHRVTGTDHLFVAAVERLEPGRLSNPINTEELERHLLGLRTQKTRRWWSRAN